MPAIAVVNRNVATTPTEQSNLITSYCMDIGEPVIITTWDVRNALYMAQYDNSIVVAAKARYAFHDLSIIRDFRMFNIQFHALDIPSCESMDMLLAIEDNKKKVNSLRTQQGLLKAKSKGAKLGNKQNLMRGNKISVEKNRKAAQDRAEKLRTTIVDLMNDGITTYNPLANELNRIGIKTANGSKWHPTTVGRVLKRLGLR
jgi:DNA invertase Pin-like site-specific DNA recombinase